METELAAVRQAAAEILRVKPERIRPDTDLTEELGADSLELYEIVTELMEHFQVEMPEIGGSGLRTVSDVAQALHAAETAE